MTNVSLTSVETGNKIAEFTVPEDFAHLLIGLLNAYHGAFDVTPPVTHQPIMEPEPEPEPSAKRSHHKK